MSDSPFEEQQIEQPLVGDASSQPLPPLSIHHFFLWTIAVAAVMSVLNVIGIPEEWRSDGQGELFTITLVPFSIAATTFLLCLYWRSRGYELRFEPGHWLLLSLTLSLIVVLEQMFALSYFGNTPVVGTAWHIFIRLIPFAMGVVAMGVYIVAARRPEITRSWRRFFWVSVAMIAARIAIPFLGYMLIQLLFPASRMEIQIALLIVGPVLFVVISMVFAIIALFHDLADQHRHHWSHWCGVSVWLFTNVAYGVMATISALGFLNR